MTSKTPHQNRLVIALASALAFSLLAIAFLLGRVTAKPAEPAATMATPASVPVAGANAANPTSLTPESTTASIATPESASSEAAEPALARLGPPLPPAFGSRPAAPPSNPNPTLPASPDRQAITDYFERIEAIDDIGSGDPQAFATSMLQSVASGDFSGFDDLLARARRQQDRLRGITPPRSCVDHHRLALVLSGDSVRILENIKAALVRGDSAALMSIAAEGGDLQTRANQLKSMGEAIKRPAG